MPRLNASFVKTTKAVGRFGDGRGGYGLALLVRPRAGGGVRKSWTQRVRVGGRATNLGLGQYPLVELAEARAKALENARAVAAGRDPRTSAAPTFEEAAQEVIRLRITSRAIYVTGGYSPTRRGEQPAPTLPRQSRSTR